jgi:hypothetical protein
MNRDMSVECLSSSSCRTIGILLSIIAPRRSTTSMQTTTLVQTAGITHGKEDVRSPPLPSRPDEQAVAATLNLLDPQMHSLHKSRRMMTLYVYNVHVCTQCVDVVFIKQMK